MLIPTLKAAKLSYGRGDISEADEQYVLRSIREIVEDLGDRRITDNDGEKDASEDEAIGQEQQPEAVRILGCPAHDGADQAALEMLQNLLDPARWNLELVAPDTLTAELLDLVAEKKPALVCIAATPPGGSPIPATCASVCGRGFPSCAFSFAVGVHEGAHLLVPDSSKRRGPTRLRRRS